MGRVCGVHKDTLTWMLMQSCSVGGEQTAGADASSATNCKSHVAMLLLLIQAS